MTANPLATNGIPRRYALRNTTPLRGLDARVPVPPKDVAGDAKEMWCGAKDVACSTCHRDALADALDVRGNGGVRPLTALAAVLTVLLPVTALVGVAPVFGVLGGLLSLYQFLHDIATRDN